MSRTAPDAVSKMSIFDDFECIGQWDVPALGSGLCGRLIHDKNGISLEVMSVPEKRDALLRLALGTEDGSPCTAPYIRGVTETGEHVVLGKCAESSRELRSFDTGPNDAPAASPGIKDAPGVVTARYGALSMHASRAPLPDSPSFEHMSVTYTSLSQWLGRNRAHVKPGDGASLSITIDMPDDCEARISDELLLQVSRTESAEKNLLRHDAYAIHRSESIRFVSPSPRTPSWFYGHARTFRNFLMMSTRYPVHAETFRSALDGHDVGVLPVYIGLAKPGDDNNIRNMYFDYQLVKETFGRTVTRVKL